MSSDLLYESANRLPQFTAFGTDLELPGALRQVAAQIAFRGEIIVVCGDAAPTASSANGLNTVLQLRALRLHHILYISDSAESCNGLRAVLPSLACVWSSRIKPTKPENGGLCVQLYWGFAFYFYDLRKHYTARLTIELGLNVLQTDTDVVWLANPYPALKQVYGGVQIVAMQDRPMVNAGVFYAQNVKRGDGAAWILEELARRIHLFILHPEAPPFYANVDEQTLMNDCVRSSIANVTSYAQATAGWEVKKHRTGTTRNRSFVWKATAEYKLLGYLNRAVPARGQRGALATTVRLDHLCRSPTVSSAGTIYPLHAVGSSEAPRASVAVGASWLFMSVPTSMSAAAVRRCISEDDGATSPSAQGAAPQQPFVMGHLAGIRTGAWSRRVIVRAYGWWHASADALVATQLGWGRRRGALLLQEPRPSGSLLALSMRSPMGLDVLAGNLLLLGLVLGRRAVIPEVLCASMSKDAQPRRGFSARPVAARGRQRGGPTCAWVPPRECWSVEYVTAIEWERQVETQRQRRVPDAPSRLARDMSRPAAADGHLRGRRLAAANVSDGQRSRVQRLKARVAAGEFAPALLRELASAQEQLAATDAATDATGGRLQFRGSWNGKGRAHAGLSGCDATGRQLAYVLAPPASRAPATAGAVRNGSASVLRRRLRELACNPSRVLAVLPEQPVPANSSRVGGGASSAADGTGDGGGGGGGGVGDGVRGVPMAPGVEPALASAELTVLHAILSPMRQERHAAQMLRLLASVPLTRQVLSLERWLAHRRSATVPALDAQREATDLKCIGHLLGPTGA